MAGTNSVYLFNASKSAITMTLNGYPIAGMAAAPTSGYAPSTSTIGRTYATGPTTNTNQFGENNVLIVAFTDWNVSAKFIVDGIGYGEVPENDDLQLYIFKNLAVLILSDSSVSTLTGQRPSDAELKEFEASAEAES